MVPTAWRDDARNVITVKTEYDTSYGYPTENLHLSVCDHCKKATLWVKDRIFYPPYKASHEPNEDLPEEIKKDFLEADCISSLSPRGAAALLRLCIQKLCNHLLGDEAEKTIDASIAKLVGKGLDAEITDALDTVRVIGNEAVHPGELDIRDDLDTVTSLFELVNFIADRTITQPKVRSEMFKRLPKTKVDGIKQRNEKAREAAE